MDPILERLKSYFKNTPRDIVERDWNALSAYANVGPSIPEFLASLDVKPKEWEYNMHEHISKKQYNTNKNSEDQFGVFFI